MSGIVGIWRLSGQPVADEELVQMSARMGHRGPDGVFRWVKDSVGLGCQMSRVTPESVNEVQPLVDPSGIAIVYDGRLDNRKDLINSIGERREFLSSAPDPVLLMAAYKKYGESLAEKLVGDFAFAIFDSVQHRMLLVRDPIGVRPLYYYHNANLFIFASELKAILQHREIPSVPDDNALAVLLLGGHPLIHRDRTCFKNVFSLVPAHLAIVTPDSFRIRQYFDFDLSPPTAKRTKSDTLEEFRERFRIAVQRRMRTRHPVGISVSGGLDSSSIFCLAEQVRRGHPSAYPRHFGITMAGAPGSPADEVAYVQEIEKAYAVEIERIPLDSFAGFAENIEDEIWHVETPILDNQWNVTQVLQRKFVERGARVMMTGHWGDQLFFTHAYLVDLFRKGRFRKAFQDLREYDKWFSDGEPKYLKRFAFIELLRGYLPDALIPPLKRLRQLMRGVRKDARWFEPEFQRLTIEEARANRPRLPEFPCAYVKSLYLEVRSRYNVHCMEWDTKVAAYHGLEWTGPVLDKELVSFLLRVPADVGVYGGIPRYLQREGMRGIVPEKILARNTKGDFNHIVNRGLRLDQRKISEVLAADAEVVTRRYVRGESLPERVNAAINSSNEDDCTDSWLLADLVAFELWLKGFFRAKKDLSAEPNKAPDRRLEGNPHVQNQAIV